MLSASPYYTQAPRWQTVAAAEPIVRYGLLMNRLVSDSSKLIQGHKAMRKSGLSLLLALFSMTSVAQQVAPATVDENDELFIINPIVENPVQVEITEWPVPYKDSRPRDPDVAPNGVIWMVGQGGDYAARFDPATKEFTRKVLPPGTGPHNLIIDTNGSLWIAGNRQGFIGKMNSSTGELVRYTMPDNTARDPHTLVFSGKDEIWFTMQWSSPPLRHQDGFKRPSMGGFIGHQCPGHH